MRAVAVLILLAVAACGGGGSLPPLPPSPPPAVERPGVKVFDAAFVQPMGVALRCGGPGLGSPFACELPDGASWGVLPQADGGGSGCIDPQPNGCFNAVDGVLNFHSGDPGMALISAKTFDGQKPHSLEAVVFVRNDCGGVSYTGVVDYAGGADDGDPTGTYAATYISCSGPSDPPKVWLYRPHLALPISGPVSPGAHVLRQDYIPDQGFAVYLDGAQIKTPGTDEVDLLRFPVGHDPHFALWFGRVDGYYTRFDGYMVP